MGSLSRVLCFFLFTFFLLSGFADSSSTFLSKGIFKSPKVTARTLQKEDCSINFEYMNYTIFTTNCTAPRYPAKQCCDALRVFACPFAEAINDLRTVCASNMFTYINYNGKYPPGVFSEQCVEGDNGLDCIKEEAKKKKSNGAKKAVTHTTLLTVIIGSLPLFYSMV
ncbi:GPI-anchored protein LLG1-like [Fagus crenata]